MDTGTTAWVLTAASLVLLMTPGLAMFYGGMTRSRGVLNMMMMSFGAAGLVSVLWVLYGYSVAFGDSQGGLVGDPTQYLGLEGLLVSEDEALPSIVFVAFQSVFAILTVALVSGAIADRAKFGAWMVFAGAWATLVYFPVAHWVFAFQGEDLDQGGWIGSRLGTIDLAGGTAVHINAGAAALALAFVLGKRNGFGREPMRPGNLPIVMLGAGLLWFGWFGFNGASFLTADVVAGYVWVNTLVATGASMLGWLLVERLRDGKPTSLGAASGVVAGLVAITPACGAVSPMGAIFIGLIAGVVCAFAVGLKYRLGYDDSLDVVGIHLVGGLLGTVLIYFFATEEASAYGVNGLFYGGGSGQLLFNQTVPALAVLAYSFVLAFAIGFVIDKTMGFRISEEDEAEGVDQGEHAENAYDFGSYGGSGFRARATSAASKEEVSA
ncbi:MAG: ammonium transporter [Kineosporiaceae bacterium]